MGLEVFFAFRCELAVSAIRENSNDSTVKLITFISTLSLSPLCGRMKIAQRFIAGWEVYYRGVGPQSGRQTSHSARYNDCFLSPVSRALSFFRCFFPALKCWAIFGCPLRGLAFRKGLFLAIFIFGDQVLATRSLEPNLPLADYRVEGRRDAGPTDPLGFTSAFDPRQIQLGVKLFF